MQLLDKNAIFAIEDRVYEILTIPEWNGAVRLKSLTGRERDEFEMATVQQKNGKSQAKLENFRARLCAMCIVDENGQRIFVSRGEVSMLGNKSVAALQRIFNKCQELNGMTDRDVEELTEDFEAGEEASAPSTSA